MWKLTFKQIWKNRKSNLWIFIELFIVSILLWYCIDFLYVVICKKSEPMGVNTEHVYRVKLGYNYTIPVNRSDPDSTETQLINPFNQIVRLIGEYPGVEAVAYYFGSEPYSTNVMMQGYTADEKSVYVANIRYVSKEYEKVFQVDMLKGGFSNWDIQTSPQGAVISPELADSLFHSQEAIGKTFHDYYEPELNFKVTGISGSMKYETYRRYTPFIYTPFNANRLKWTLPGMVVGFRVRPEADIAGFNTQFMEDMKTKLNIGPFYLFSVIPYDFKAEVYNKITGVSKYIGVITSVLSFFLFIVFLGILGTAWFQMESRRNEIGLRMALGSSRKLVLKNLVFENIIILFLAFVPALLIAITLAYWEVTYTINDALDYTWSRFWITQFLTLIVMILVISLGALIPAYRASKIHPVEALRDE